MAAVPWAWFQPIITADSITEYAKFEIAQLFVFWCIKCIVTCEKLSKRLLSLYVWPLLSVSRVSHLAEFGPKTTSVLRLYAASFKFVVVQTTLCFHFFTATLRRAQNIVSFPYYFPASPLPPFAQKRKALSAPTSSLNLTYTVRGGSSSLCPIWTE